MSRSTKDAYADFCSITGASIKDAKRYLDRHKRLDAAIDAFFHDGGGGRRTDSPASPSRLASLFDKYKDPDGDSISTQGTLLFFTDLGFSEHDDDTPKLLLLAYELQSPQLGLWSRKGWTDGWKQLGCDTIDAMKHALVRLEDKLASDPAYFRSVYNHTFHFARAEGQRSLAKDTALEYWKSLLHFAVGKDALKHLPPDTDDADTPHGPGWSTEHTELWLAYMAERDNIAVSKDTWQMLPDFIRSFDGFAKHDDQAAWPTIIDQFVDWAKKKGLD